MRANADVCITFGQEDPIQVEAICEHYLSRIPKPDAIRLLAQYAYHEPAGGKRYCLLIDVTDRFGAKSYEQRIYQVLFKQTPPFIVGTEDYWGESYWMRLQYLRDAFHRLERAGPDQMFATSN